MIRNDLKRGDLVDCICDGGEKVIRKVVELGESVVYICTLDEFAEAERIGTEEVCIGFPNEDVTKHKV